MIKSIERENVTLAIKLNTDTGPAPCALCGRETEPLYGPELTVDGSSAAVCRDCGARHAPALAALLELGALGAMHYAEHLRMFARRAEPDREAAPGGRPDICTNVRRRAGRGGLIECEMSSDALSDEHIYAGDVVLIRPTSRARRNDLVFAEERATGRWVAGAYCRQADGSVRIVGRPGVGEAWFYGKGEVRIVGRVIGSDAFHSIEDLEPGGVR
jgi:hypothetical protein